jgi:hypothetical protein
MSFAFSIGYGKDAVSEGAWAFSPGPVSEMATRYGALNPDPHDRSNYNWEAIYWTIGLIVVALAWFTVLMIMRRDKVDAAAEHAAEHHGVPPLDETLEYGPAQ